MKRMRLLSGSCLLLVLAGVQTPAWSQTQEAEEPKERIVVESVTGDVAYVGKRAISVEISSTPTSSTEMLLPVDDKTAVERVRNLSDLKRGDRVSVVYEKAISDQEDGTEKILRTTAKKITLVRSGGGSLETESLLRSDTTEEP